MFSAVQGTQMQMVLDLLKIELFKIQRRRLTFADNGILLFCPALAGDFTLAHNTPVELSYTIAKNYTDPGFLAQQLSGLKSYLAREEICRRKNRPSS